MALPVPLYRQPNTFVSGGLGGTLGGGALCYTYINATSSKTTTNTQNKNGGVIVYGNPGATQSRFHLESDSNIVGRPLTSMRIGGYPVDTVNGGQQGASGAMGITTANPNLSFGKVTAQQYQIFSLKPVMSLGGSGTTVLSTPGARFAGLDKVVQNKNPGYVYTARQVTAGWNYVTGRFLIANPSGTKDTLNTDNTANPSRALPGILVYLDAGKTIASGYLYKSKTD